MPSDMQGIEANQHYDSCPMMGRCAPAARPPGGHFGNCHEAGHTPRRLAPACYNLPVPHGSFSSKPICSLISRPATCLPTYHTLLLPGSSRPQDGFHSSAHHHGDPAARSIAASGTRWRASKAGQETSVGRITGAQWVRKKGEGAS